MQEIGRLISDIGETDLVLYASMLLDLNRALTSERVSSG